MTGLLIILVLIVVLAGVPAYVIGQRTGVRQLWAAFVPFGGPTIVLLRSIGRSGWMVLLGLVPVVNFITFGLYGYAFTLATTPRTHGFTRTVVR